MCLILFAVNVHPRYPLIVIANRDEFHQRATATAHYWQDSPQLFAGRDLARQGTWLGVTNTGRFAALTNYRQANANTPSPHSRGYLVKDFLDSDETADSYLHHCQTQATQYDGFNLLSYVTGEPLYYYANRENTAVSRVSDGIHGLCNHLLDTPWYKVEQGKYAFSLALAKKTVSIERLFQVLMDTQVCHDEHLPNTGVSLEWERLLSSRFIISEDYGTRSSSIVLIDKNQTINFYERSFNPQGLCTATVHQEIKNIEKM